MGYFRAAFIESLMQKGLYRHIPTRVLVFLLLIMFLLHSWGSLLRGSYYNALIGLKNEM